MLCPGCGKENAPHVALCIQCGTRLPESAGRPSQAVPPPSRFPRVAAPAPPASYLWGKIHGWGMLASGLLLFLLCLWVLLAPASDKDTRLGAIVAMAVLALVMLTGLGLVRQMKFGLVLVYVWTGLHLVLVLNALLVMVVLPNRTFPGARLVGLGLVFWGVCSVYYHRRRSLFH